MKLLLIEDDIPIAAMIRRGLESEGYEVVVCRDGRKGLSAAFGFDFGVIILDLMLPEMDGLQVCRRVREAGRLAHIILLTARGGEENLIEGFRAGADDYLVKPFRADELHARILVGLRVMTLQETLVDRVKALEAAASEIESLKLHIPV